jgi:hypothetical protein
VLFVFVPLVVSIAEWSSSIVLCGRTIASGKERGGAAIFVTRKGEASTNLALSSSLPDREYGLPLYYFQQNFN